MTKELTKVDQRELHTLAKSINDREQSITQLKGRVSDVSGQAVTEAILQGDELSKVKHMLDHGMWLPWLKVHCPMIGERMAQKYIRLAEKYALNPNLNSDLDQCRSIDEALGLFANSKQLESGVVKKMTEDMQALYLVNRMSVRVVDYLTSHPLEDIVARNPSAYVEMRKDTEEMVGKLGGTVNWNQV